ncbi:WPP domain-interacting protein 1 [Medicago truncatula]|uniref:WPP domain interacting protein, putative n=1 Tax=Medicago truncatula TaxID=3880 RepID=G7J0C1_MEDTR|nr:WPP domain-interacting protein 1 [Medicago truncatula]AES68526.1 WPP domain interacting protein, putative [Medicago truncatula]
MDLGSESVEENEVNHDENGIKGCDEKSGFQFDGNFGVKPDQEGIVAELGSEEAVNSKGAPRKGVGLKKWKRIRRNVVRDHNSSADESGKVLKRGLSGSGNVNLSENLRGVKEKNDGSSSAFGNVVFSDGHAIRGSSTDSRYAVGSGFVVGTDSENSEDRSSKSSTAASEPKVRHEKGRGSRNTNSKNLVNSAQKVQQGKGWIESSAKPGGGGRVKFEKENSISSLDSDSRSNYKQAVFSTVTSNGKHSGNPHVYDGDNDGEANTNEHFTEEHEAGYGNENGEDEDLQENSAANQSWDAPEEKSENNQSTSAEDPLIESIRSLQAVQEALEEEVQKFREIDTEVVSPEDDSAKCSSASAGITAVDLGFHKSFLSSHSSADETNQSASSSLEFQISSLKQHVNLLESKLGELQGVLSSKDSRIVELETALSSGKFPKEESANTLGYKEVEYEIEDLFRQKVEAEVEYLAIAKVMQNLKVGADLQFTLLEEQEKLSENQAQVLNKIIDAESKASVLKNKAEELEKYCGDSLVIEESFLLQKRVCKVSFYLFLQFMMLILFFCFLVSQLSQNSGVVVPT